MTQQSLSGKTVIDKLTGEFELLFDFRAICTKFPMFSNTENVELSVLAEEMTKLEIPTAN